MIYDRPGRRLPNVSKTGFHKERILITGASSGLGRSFARKLLATDNGLLLTARRASDSLGQEFPDAALYDLDLTSKSDLEKWVFGPLKEFGPSVAILNAGGGHFQHFSGAPLEKTLETVSLNITANLILCRALLPQMIARALSQGRRAKLLLVSSHAAFLRVPNFAVYASCKGFINQFIRTLMLEHWDDPIDIACFCPGAMQSQFSEKAKIPAMLSKPASTDQMAAYALKKFRNRRIIIPRTIDKVFWMADRLLPGTLLDQMVRLSQKRYLRKGSAQAPDNTTS